MATSLLTPGFWQAKFWTKGFWIDKFWQNKGEPTALLISSFNVYIEHSGLKLSSKALFLKMKIKNSCLKIQI